MKIMALSVARSGAGSIVVSMNNSQNNVIHRTMFFAYVDGSMHGAFEHLSSAFNKITNAGSNVLYYHSMFGVNQYTNRLYINFGLQGRIFQPLPAGMYSGAQVQVCVLPASFVSSVLHRSRVPDDIGGMLQPRPRDVQWDTL